MKKLIGSLMLSVLFSGGLFAWSAERPVQPALWGFTGAAEPSAPARPDNEAKRHPATVSLGDVLRAHNVPQSPGALSGFDAEAVRLTSRPPEIARELQSFFERHVRVVMADNLYKRHTSDPRRLREQYDLFDGNLTHHAVIEKGRPAATLTTDPEARSVEFGVKTFGLVPILIQLSDPATEAAYLGRTAYGQDKFSVKTATNSWTLYTDSEHLIRRLEVKDMALEFAGYRPVDGLRLPFIERLSGGGQLVQELNFTRITINPKLPANYFSRETLSQEAAQ